MTRTRYSDLVMVPVVGAVPKRNVAPQLGEQASSIADHLTPTKSEKLV